VSKSSEIDLADPTLTRALSSALDAGREEQRSEVYNFLIGEMAQDGSALHLMNIGNKIFMFKDNDMVYVPVLNLEPSA
jgi:hypothetical protein